jgi:hypothetical protein
MIGVSNDLTNNLIASCLRNAKKQLSEWPGTEFSTATDEGHALLGESLSLDQSRWLLMCTRFAKRRSIRIFPDAAQSRARPEDYYQGYRLPT